MKHKVKLLILLVKDFYQEISVDKHQVSDAQSDYFVVINNSKNKSYGIFR